MSQEHFENLLLESAEQTDRKLGPARIAQLKLSYEFFKSCGLSDEQVKDVMALTSHEVRLIRNAG